MKFRLIAALSAIALGAGACSTQNSTDNGPANSSKSEPVIQKTTLNLGYAPNVTHAPAVYGVESGNFARTLGAKVELKTSSYTAGPAAIEALLSGAIDAAFVGPGPAASVFITSSGTAAHVVAGVASGGAFLVVRPNVTSPRKLKGLKIASPQLNGTQDIALRWYLKQQGFTTDINGGGEVHVLPQENAQTLDAFKSGEIDGAWVPEPWATRLVEAGGKVLVDERDKWPNRMFVTTVLIVNPEFQAAHPEVVRHLIVATSDAIDAIKARPLPAAQVVSRGIEKITTKPIDVKLVTASFKNITFTLDPLADTLRTVHARAVKLGMAKKADLTGLFDLAILNSILMEKGLPKVKT